MLIGQITDCHIVEPGGVMADRVDPTPGLRAAIAYLNSIADTLDLVIGTGDLVNDGSASQYAQLESLLAELETPFLAVPGNHDDRTELRQRFHDLPAGGHDQPIDHVVALDGLTLVCLDTLILGHHDGRLDAEQLAWLDATLDGLGDTPVMVVQHHPPFASGIDAMDRFQLAGADVEREIIGRHANVVGVIGGHYHRSIHRTIGTASAFACPSTAVQLVPRLGPGPTTYSVDPGALALHDVGDGSMTTHIVQLVDGDSWSPSWADDG